jgi:hypothetical protein
LKTRYKDFHTLWKTQSAFITNTVGERRTGEWLLFIVINIRNKEINYEEKAGLLVLVLVLVLVVVFKIVVYMVGTRPKR